MDFELQEPGLWLSKADTLKQIENDKVADIIIATLMDSENPMTVTEMQKSNEELATYSNQKISAIIRKLVESAQVIKTVEKKKSYFSVCWFNAWVNVGNSLCNEV